MFFPSKIKRFHFFNPGSYEDALAQKGILYAKIDLGDNFVHIFTLHTQANVLSSEKEREIPNNLSRVNQIIESKIFIESILEKYFSNSDLAFLMGDFNVNANCGVYPLERILTFFEVNLFANENLNGKNEYDLIMKIFENSEIYEIENLFFKDGVREFPVTYGDCYICDKGNLNPKEEILTHFNDQTSSQCLDFVFELKKKIINHVHDVLLLDESRENLKDGFEKCNYGSCKAKVNPFEIKGKIFTQLSDHHAVEFEINRI